MKAFCVTLFVLFNVALTYGQSSSLCYFCRSYIEGEVCNDPVNTTAISQQRCSNFTIVETLDQFATRAQQYNEIRDESLGDESRVVCAKLAYVLNGELVTVRGCEFALYEGQEFCSFLREDLANNPALNYSDITCSVCDTDLCNSSSPLYVSLTILLYALLLVMFH